MDTPSFAKLATALVKVQATLTGATKTATNPHFKSKYATLEDCWDACRKPLTENGLCVVQLTTSDKEGNVGVTTVLAHESGEAIQSTFLVKPDRPGPQAAGSAITYARRYGLMAIVGLCPTDDDAESATLHVEQPKRTPKPFVKNYNQASKL